MPPTPPPLTRRQLLSGLAALSAAAVTGCGSGSAHGPSPGPSTTSAGPTATVAPPDWDGLRASMRGTLLRPADAPYDAARLLFNRRFDGIRPQAVAQAATEQDVVTCVRFARDHDVPLRVRAGGHSYLGASAGDGLVVDLRRLADIATRGSRATIGGGATLLEVYRTLAAHGVSIPAGSCPSVGLSGLALGGGMGVVARQYGLTCDRLVRARVVLADGRVVTAGTDEDADLLWALRGGGGNFGVVTELEFDTHPTRELAVFTWSWSWTDAAAVLTGWQQWAVAQPDALWSTCHLLATTDASGPTVSVSGVCLGGSAVLRGLLDGLRSAVGRAPRHSYLADKDYLDTMRLEAGCSSISDQACQVRDFGGNGALPRDAFVAASDVFERPIAAADVDALASAVQSRQDDPALGVGGVGFDSWGGAVGAVAPGDTAFVHRRALFVAQYTASWQDQAGNGPQAANQASLQAMRAALRPSATGSAYQNYADPTLPDPLQAYYGSNLRRLRQLKKRYDPDQFFQLPQGISPG